MLLVAAPAADAARRTTPPAPTYKLTLAARSCPTFADVTANRARNNIQETILDLGPNTRYQAGDPIDPDEEAERQPRCTPITGWRFTLGTGVGAKVPNGGDLLSVVNNPFATSVVTRRRVPKLTLAGTPAAPAAAVAGATTITLTREQALLALAGTSRLWVQGGTVEQPVLNETPPFAGHFNFAALRCSVDNLNGDNVEWVTYLTGTFHMYCYAYYVRPQRDSGTIEITKQTTSAPGTAPTTFTFLSNLSYVTNDQFTLSPPANGIDSITFTRASTLPGEQPWHVRELEPPGWRNHDIACTSRDGTSTTATAPGQGSSVAIRLGAGDLVRCRYFNIPQVDTTLLVTKRTVNGIGSFPVAVVDPTGGRHEATLSTANPLRSATFDTGLRDVGTYTISETLPTSNRGRWKLTDVVCNGVSMPTTLPVTVTLTGSTTQPQCVLTNEFVPSGSITINGVAWNGTPVKRFHITNSSTSTPIDLTQTARLTEEGIPVQAKGDASDELPLGVYAVQELEPLTIGGDWRLVDITCTTGAIIDRVVGGVIVRLTATSPDVACAFTNRRDAQPSGPETSPSPSPGPTPAPAPSPGPGPEAVDPSGDGTTIDAGDPTSGSGPFPGVLPAGGVSTGFGSSGIPAPFRPGSPEHALLQVDPADAAHARGGAVAARARSRAQRSGMSIRIPRLGVNARIQTLALTGRRVMRVPANPDRVGWWGGSAVPGARGASVLVGHVDGPSGPAVFHRAGQLDRGDRILVRHGRQTYRYSVTHVRSFPKQAVPRSVYQARASQRTLRLITCGGWFNPISGRYADNVVVYARRT